MSIIDILIEKGYSSISIHNLVNYYIEKGYDTEHIENHLLMHSKEGTLDNILYYLPNSGPGFFKVNEYITLENKIKNK